MFLCRDNKPSDDHEEEFYYNEVELDHASSPPTLSHRDMARPPHEDPEYQRQIVGSIRLVHINSPHKYHQDFHPQKIIISITTPRCDASHWRVINLD